MKLKSKFKKGIALFTVLVVAAALLTILSMGLKLGSNGVLFASQAHKRNVSLSAAEAGVHEAMILLLNDKNYSGTSSGTLSDSNADYEVTVVNEIFSTRVARVTSTGEYGGVRRTLEVELEPDSAGFNAVSVDGRVFVFDNAYVNGIASPGNPISRPGSSHTEFDQSGLASYQGEAYGGGSVTPRLHGTGELSTQGFFDSGLSRTSLGEETNVGRPQFRFDKAQMLSGGGFAVGTTSLANVAGNTVVGTPPADPSDPFNEYVFLNKVIVPKGTTLHVQGNAKFLGGISGEGQVVTDGDFLVQTDGVFDPSLEEGLKVLVGGSAFIAHPQTEITVDDVEPGTPNNVGDFFARMPPEASLDIPVALPTDAPQGGTFFDWFDSQVDTPTPNFNLWYNGDGTDIYPGLTQETKDWLQESRAIHSDISSWAASASSP